MKVQAKRRGEKNKKRSRSELARHAAQHKRINRQHLRKKHVLNRWYEWKLDNGLHKNQAAFINSMLEEYNLERPETIRRWIKEFERARKSQRSWDELMDYIQKKK